MSRYIIENDQLKLVVSSVGAEMISLVKKDSGVEYLKGLGGDFWQRCAPILFPINGRLWENTTLVNGKKYEMGTHGLSKLYDFALESNDGTSLTLTMKDEPDTYESAYPFHFALSVTFTLEANAVKTTVKVKNTGDSDMPYSLGFHPAFKVPMVDGDDFADYYIEFSEETKPNTWVLSPRYYIVHETAPYALEDGKRIPLYHEMFDGDAIFLQDIPNRAWLRSKKSDISVKFDYEGFPYVGLWHTPMTKAEFVCFEPWNGRPDYDGEITELLEKEDMTILAKDCENQHSFTITIE